jgi:hypothetical protein
MATKSRSFWARAVPLMVAGPAAVGAALASNANSSAGPLTALAGAAVLSAIVVGTWAAMLPALYIGAAFLGVAPRAQAVARSAGAALGDMGLVFLGLAPPLFFLVASSSQGVTVRVLGYTVVTAGVALGLRALFVRLFDRRSLKALGLFAGWSLVSFGIGASLFARLVPLP